MVSLRNIRIIGFWNSTRLKTITKSKIRAKRPDALAKPMILLPVTDAIQKANVIPRKKSTKRASRATISATITRLKVRESVLAPCNLINSILVSIYSLSRALFSLKKLKNVSFEAIGQLLPVRY
jgi:hypothetical protein